MKKAVKQDDYAHAFGNQRMLQPEQKTAVDAKAEKRLDRLFGTSVSALSQFLKAHELKA